MYAIGADFFEITVAAIPSSPHSPFFRPLSLPFPLISAPSLPLTPAVGLGSDAVISLSGSRRSPAAQRVLLHFGAHRRLSHSKQLLKIIHPMALALFCSLTQTYLQLSHRKKIHRMTDCKHMHHIHGIKFNQGDETPAHTRSVADGIGRRRRVTIKWLALHQFDRPTYQSRSEG